MGGWAPHRYPAGPSNNRLQTGKLQNGLASKATMTIQSYKTMVLSSSRLRFQKNKKISPRSTPYHVPQERKACQIVVGPWPKKTSLVKWQKFAHTGTDQRKFSVQNFRVTDIQQLFNTALIIHHSSYTTRHTPLIIHHSSYTAHHTPLIMHHSSYTTHHTRLIIHRSSYTTHHTPLIIHHSSNTTHHTPLIIHHSSYTTHHTPLIIHH